MRLMVRNSRLCKLLGVEFPIIQGGMLWLANSCLAAAVSESGALGVISPMAGMAFHEDPADNLRKEIRAGRRLTRKPLGANIPLDLNQSGELIDVVLSENMDVVITAAGNPGYYTEVLRANGVTVFHVVSSLGQAETAQSCGVNGIIAEGVEAAGHNGRDEIPLFSLIPQIVDSVSIPVVAAGGIVDARGFAAAMALGAEGVQLGTRFVAVDECIAHPEYKQAIIEAGDTVITCRRLTPTRSLKTAFSMRLAELENAGAGADELRRALGYRRARKGQLEGDLEDGEVYCGSSVGAIKEMVPAASVVKGLVRGYVVVLRKLNEYARAFKGSGPEGA